MIQEAYRRLKERRARVNVLTVETNQSLGRLATVTSNKASGSLTVNLIGAMKSNQIQKDK